MKTCSNCSHYRHTDKNDFKGDTANHGSEWCVVMPQRVIDVEKTMCSFYIQKDYNIGV